MDDYLKYRYSEDIEFNIKENEFITIIGNSNAFLIKTLLNGDKDCNIFVGDKEITHDNAEIIRRRMSFVLYKHLDIFVGETVQDEIIFGLESLAMKKDDIRNLLQTESRLFKLDHLLDKDPNSLGSNDKVKMKILSSMIVKPKVLVIDNIMSELDYNDKLLVFDLLKEFKKDGGIVINLTNDIEETLFGDKIIIVNDKKLICEGKTISVLNEEKILKRLGLGLPFMVELSKYLMDYGVINKYALTNEKLEGEIWK